jgi:iron(III) transport system substrate-binding protein
MGTLAACQAVAPAGTGAATETAAELGTETAPATGDGTLVIYSGRTENLVAPLIEQFRQASGLDVDVRYGNTAEMAATIMEEGANSPADVYFSQDAGALGALASAGRLSPLPAELLERVPERFRSPEGTWIGISARARVLAYNTENVDPAELPADVYGLTDPKWRGRIGWAPTNASFQAFVTALRVLDGEEAARQWLEDMIANDVQVYDGNTAVVNAVAAGEIDLGLVNHYYLFQLRKEQGDDFPVENYYFPTAGAGSIINIGGAGILDTSSHRAAAEQFVAYLLSDEAQQYFANETSEYPLTGDSVTVDPRLQPLDTLTTPDLDLSRLEDLQGTLTLLQETGALQ